MGVSEVQKTGGQVIAKSRVSIIVLITFGFPEGTVCPISFVKDVLVGFCSISYLENWIGLKASLFYYGLRYPPRRVLVAFVSLGSSLAKFTSSSAGKIYGFARSMRWKYEVS